MIVAALAGMTGIACSNSSYTGKIVAVELPGTTGSQDHSALILIDPEASGKEPDLLTEDFLAAASPSLSHDGRFLYFQGKKQEGDPWQIWMVDLNKKSFTQVTDLPENCTDPVPLPDETVVFSRESSVRGIPVADLWRCGTDGCCLTRITYTPSHNSEATMLAEGRILFLSSQQVPESHDPMLMVMRPDGTKSELYQSGCCGWSPVSGGAESEDGYIYFIAEGGRLSRVLHNRPLHTYENLSEEIPGSFASVKPLPDGNCLVAYTPSPGEPFGIYTYAPGMGGAPELLYRGKGDVIDPVKVMALKERPRKLPSAVNPENPTGLLMSQNINNSMLKSHAGIGTDTVASRIRVSYLAGNEALVDAAEDGSFYLKLDADMPFRIETLNSSGVTVRGPSDWIYLRPNERRACTGCHADPELAPENIQPLAVKTDPVEIYAKHKEMSN